jgi:hypothetical protein
VDGVKSPQLLELDSGTNAPLLYDPEEQMAKTLAASPQLRSRGADGTEHIFVVLPPREIWVGGQTIHQVPFVTPVSARKGAPRAEVDGLLPTLLFRRIFVSPAGHFAVLEQ